MQKFYFSLFIISLLVLFSTLFVRYYLIGRWSIALILLMVDSLLATIITFLSLKNVK